MHDHKVYFAGADIETLFDAVLSTFEQTPPEPKTYTVEIPAGADIDVTEALGPVAFRNGRHKFVLLLSGEEVDIVSRTRELMALVHGKRTEYTLSWDEGYTYTGRWAITDIERIAPHATLITIEVDRYPWKIGTTETVELNAHPTDSYTLEGSERYSNITLRGTQPATVVIDGVTIEVSSGTNQLAAQVLDDTEITVTVGDWICYLDGTNLVVNEPYITIENENAQFASPTFELVDTDLRSEDEAGQHFTLTYTRKDL